MSGIDGALISAEGLIRNKVASGKLQDLADVEAIREADKANYPKHGYPPALKRDK